MVYTCSSDRVNISVYIEVYSTFAKRCMNHLCNYYVIQLQGHGITLARGNASQVWNVLVIQVTSCNKNTGNGYTISVKAFSLES
jgi:hypothetical protein